MRGVFDVQKLAVEVTDHVEIDGMYILGVSEDKPKPVQAQAIKARTAKFKLRHAGQAHFASPSDKSGPEGVGEASPPRNEEWKDRPDSPMSDDNDRDPISPNLTLEDPGSVGGAEPTASAGDNHTDPTEDNAPAISCTLLVHQPTVNAEVEEQDLSSQKIKASSFKENLNSLASRNRSIEAGSPVQTSGCDCMDKMQELTDGADPAITNTPLQPSGVVEGPKRPMSGGDHSEGGTCLHDGWASMRQRRCNPTSHTLDFNFRPEEFGEASPPRNKE
ncbi:hypothetical protein B0H13DRAFT_1881568 [Mycena leptocephala]|nr:hypothetical protein B0H13DRAFT_1881568 [Mycena leptocephala]